MYNNIFHYFRGQAEDANEATAMKQQENNVTKAFMNVLEHSHPNLLQALLRNLGVDEANNEVPEEYIYQVGSTSKLNVVKQYAAVLGISQDGTIKRADSGIIKDTIPDAAIITTSTALMVEVKIRSDQLYEEQLTGHRGRFAEGQIIRPKPVVRTWKEIRDIFDDEHKRLKEMGETVSCFLIEQFQEFCDYNRIGKDSTEPEDIIRLFRTVKEQELAKSIHSYIMGSPELKISHELKFTGDNCIEYKHKNHPARNYLTLIADNHRRGLIVRRKGAGGIALQREIDRLTGKTFDRKGLPSNEAFIRFDFWNGDVTDIYRFIDETADYLK